MIYACSAPYFGADGVALYLVWGDAPSEAHAALWAASVDPDSVRRWDLNAWEAYAVPTEAYAAVVALGVVVTNKYGPALWCARRDGDARRIAILEKASDAAGSGI